jgi:hypothetical protein
LAVAVLAAILLPDSTEEEVGTITLLLDSAEEEVGIRHSVILEEHPETAAVTLAADETATATAC